MCHHATKIIRFCGWNEVGRAVFYERGNKNGNNGNNGNNGKSRNE
jgi:hypothetical protein